MDRIHDRYRIDVILQRSDTITSRLQMRRLPLVLAISLILFLCGFLWSRTSPRSLAEYDQPFYVGIAYDLRNWGRFTDGFLFAGADAEQPRPPGMRFAPLYPALVAATAARDASFAAAIECVVDSSGRDPGCARMASLIRWLQFMMLVAFYVLVWWIAGTVLGTPRAGWIALAFALMTAPFLLRFVNLVMTEMTALLMLASAIGAGVAALRGSPAPWLLVAGGCLGVTALTRPAFLYLALASALVGLVLVLRHEQRWRKLPLLLAFLAGVAAVVLPWVARNAVVLGRPALTYGYDSHTLAQRVAYDRMSWRDYGLFYVCGLPDGVGLARRIFGRDACSPFSWDPEEKRSFYNVGNGAFMHDTVAAAGGWQHHLSYLLRNHVLASPLTHLLVTVPFALAGAWVNNYWGLILGIVCAVLTIRAVRTNNTGLLIVTLPGWFMLLFHAGVAVNQDRYNLILILPYAIAGAWLVERVLGRNSGASRRRFAG